MPLFKKSILFIGMFHVKNEIRSIEYCLNMYAFLVIEVSHTHFDDNVIISRLFDKKF